MSQENREEMFQPDGGPGGRTAGCNVGVRVASSLERESPSMLAEPCVWWKSSKSSTLQANHRSWQASHGVARDNLEPSALQQKMEMVDGEEMASNLKSNDEYRCLAADSFLEKMARGFQATLYSCCCRNAHKCE